MIGNPYSRVSSGHAGRAGAFWLLGRPRPADIVSMSAFFRIVRAAVTVLGTV